MSMSVDTEAGDENPEFEGANETFLFTVWMITLVIAIILPFCWNKRQRQLCRKRIRERRWIQDDGLDENDWYYARYLRQQEERRQQRLAERERFQIDKTQEDEIREQYLTLIMEGYSLILTPYRIHACTEKNTSALIGDRQNPENGDNFCNTGKPLDKVEIETDLEAPNVNTETDITSSTKDSPRILKVESDDEEGLEEMTFYGAYETVDIPQPGSRLPKLSNDVENCDENNSTNNNEGDGESTAPRQEDRQVPSGCAICLSAFLAEEKISWASNEACPHVFHHDCLLQWFHAVGRKEKKKKLRERPEMSEQEGLDLICNFPKLCPCCRQSFCTEIENPPDEALPGGRGGGGETEESSSEDPAFAT